MSGYRSCGTSVTSDNRRLLPRILEPDRVEVIHRIRLIAGQMERAVQAHLECLPDLLLKAGAKLHADIQVLGLV